MNGDLLYWSVAHALDALGWGGELLGREHLPLAAAGPAVYVSNHALARGPLAVAACLPVRLYPWVIADMLDWEAAAGYLNEDFVEPQLHVPVPFSLPLARLISQASVRLLRGVGSIPVWHGERMHETYRISLDYLLQGRSLLIFPEDPDQPLDQHCKMSPFLKSFARLGELYFESTRRILRFYPISVQPELRKVKLGGDVAYQPNHPAVQERRRLKRRLEAIVRGMYIEMTLQNYPGLPAAY